MAARNIKLTDVSVNARMLSPFDGLKIIESEYATAEPSARPHTDDMRAMVEHMRALGLIRRLPVAFKMPDGSLIAHPSTLRRLREDMTRRVEDFGRAAFYGRTL
jgi:hypothetical protein